MLKRLGRSRAAQEVMGFLLALYLKLVQRTNRFTIDPPDLFSRVDADWPVIIAMWHGQHFMVPFGKRPQDRYRVLISRHGDGGMNAIACRYFGIEAIRASGAGEKREKTAEKGGVSGLKAMLRSLGEGFSITVTADVPKTARVAGEGIVMLAALSGRPIYPFTVVTSRRFQFRSWDKASLGKPFGRGAMVLGEPVRVARDADANTREAARLQLERELDRVQKRAYALVGGADPGLALSEARKHPKEHMQL
jgi:lysophospholipid acyltransferase (LPLAT)-like uncharacterized protein